MEPTHLPTTMWKQCSIRSSLGVLGRRWALLVLRDVSFFDKTRFGDILRQNPGLSTRVLSICLRELQEEGLIARVEDPSNPRDVYDRITEKGMDVVPILTAFIQYGAKHRAAEVFADGKPRKMKDLFPRERAHMLGQLHGYATQDPHHPPAKVRVSPRPSPRAQRGS